MLSWLPSSNMNESPGGSPKSSQDLFKVYPNPKPLATSTKPGTAAKLTSIATGESYSIKPEEQERLRSRSADYKIKSASPGSTVGTTWPSLPVPSTQKSNEMASVSSPIHLEQKPKENSPSSSTTQASWKVQQKRSEDYERDSVGKYVQYFQGNTILPIPEISQTLEPRIMSLVVIDLQTKRQTGLKRSTLKNPYLQLSFHANISADVVLQPKMSCCQQSSRPQILQGAIS